jgi:hypothetical protein
MSGNMTVEQQTFRNLMADGLDRIEGGHRFLKHHSDPFSPDFTELRFLEPAQFIKFVPGGSKADTSLHTHRRGKQAHQGQGSNGFPATGLSNDSDAFSESYGKIKILDDWQLPFPLFKENLEPIHLEQVFGILNSVWDIQGRPV